VSSRKRHHNALPEGYKLHWYEIHGILGRGGFGITYQALDTNLNHEVAIKEFLPTELAMRASDSSIHPVSDDHVDTFGWGLSRFITEAQTLAQFRHPNIVLVHSVFEANGTAYMVMEYERGKSLDECYSMGQLNTEEELLNLLFPLMDGLDRIHQAGFVHRDIKPKNIYLRDDGRPVLLDFGSARQALGVETRTLTTLVSPGYAPFEQYNATRDSDKQGPWTDIYALGATIYRGFSGKSPVDALTRANAKLEGKDDVLEPATELGKGTFSHEFLTAVDWSLEFSPEERPQSVADWRAMLPQPEELPTHMMSEGYTARAHTIQSPPAAPASPTISTEQSDAPTQIAEEEVPAEDHFTDDGTLILDDGGVDAYAAREGARERSGGKGAMLTVIVLVAVAAAGVAYWQLGPKPGDTGNDSMTSAAGDTSEKALGAPASTPTSEPAGAGARVEEPPPAPKPTLAAIESALAKVACSDLQVSLEDRDVTVRGITAGEDNGVRIGSAIESVPGVAKTTTEVLVVPRIQCNVIELYSTFWKANRVSGYGTAVRTPQQDNVFREGDRLIVDVAAPSYESYLYIDYFALDGSVVHMMPSPGEKANQAAAGDTFLVGEPGDIGLWEVAPPFGMEMIVILASREPVFDKLRDEAEQADNYLNAVRKRLGTLGDSNKGGISADFVIIKTRPGS
jgi:serine/threonine protein kinase